MFLIIGFNSKAQDTDKNNHVYGGVGYFLTGYSLFQLDDLNQTFKDAGYPELDNGSISFGGGGHYIFKNFIIGGEGHGLTGSTSENSDYKTSISGGYGFFNLGYLIFNSPSINFYPLLGFGGGGLTASITDKSKLTHSYDEIMDDPLRETYITNGGFLMNFSLGLDYFFVGEKTPETTGGFIIGIKAGYVLNVSNNDWYYSGEQLNNSPNSGVSGPYLRIVFGGGGLSISN